jgi:predicted nucleotidyltransferase component of viral defense system
MTRYAIERLLYRLSLSPHRERFVLKGAMLFAVWASAPYRSTADLDLLGCGDPDPQVLATAIRDVCSMVTDDDGVTFLADTLRAEPAREEQAYQGARLTMTAVIAGARLAIHVDVGYGDAITPGVQELEYPSLLDMPRAKLLAYPPETVVAEKLHALVALGMANSRMKDFYDLWAIAASLAFEGSVLARAFGATFQRRRTPLPMATPTALTAAFADDSAKQAQWRGFLRRTEFAVQPRPFPDVIAAVADFVLPPALAAAAGSDFGLRWELGGPWKR